MEYLLNSLPGILVAIFAAYCSYRLALRRIYQEKWWDRKERAYSEIIDSIYDLLQYCEIQKDDYGQGSGYGDDKMKELANKYNQAIWKIKKATHIGTFIVSSDAEDVLKQLRDRPRLDWSEYPRWDIYHDDYQYYKDALKAIIELARKDLKAAKS